jgi:DNA polymerase
VILFWDTETFSETPIGSGTHRYAEDPFAEILIESWAIDDEEVQVADRTAGDLGPFSLYDPEDFEWIVMHNGGHFDRIVSRYVEGRELPLERVWDTDAQARAHGLPGGLDKLCGIFGVPEELMKHKDGKKLIHRFCKPQPKSFKIRRCTSATHPKEWAEFLSYAGGDIHAMRYLWKKMPRWNYPDREHALWQLDQRINDRGFKVDLDLARAAIAMVEELKAETDEQTQLDTEGRIRSTTQRDELLKELLLEYHVKMPDLQGTTIERRLGDPDLPDPVRALLGQRLMTSATSTSKYNKILSAVSSDGRLRGSLLYSGAARTKRWSGRLFQPQNLPRPNMPAEEIENGIALMKQGLAAMMVDEPMRLAWNALRGLIVAEEGCKLAQADLGQIEARVLPWLAEEVEWKLQAFRDYDAGHGPDLYRVGAGRILHKAPVDVDGYERQALGKVPELACGYGGSVGAFNTFAQLYNLDLPEHEIREIVAGWREANAAIANWTDGLWVRLEEACRNAILNPGQTFEAGPYIRFFKWKEWLKMELPSGGFLSYAHPHIADHKYGGPNAICFYGINNYTRKWEQMYTYGGKLSADATQATAREILAHNLPHVDEKYPIVLQVHDEVLTEVPDDPAYSAEDLISRLTRRPPWIDDKLPLAAGGFEAYRYRKE